ncbi:hypothetical protein SAMN02745244_02506 [Tessaracoccus bendigoensis DSM 12906]|uniref:Uncharacterized protein n=1 Tax=Tessaracoccus bendigoensis DSM 12906 TaxID=1123357 RepID=A0A1M6JAB2_9ACTN|nr:hypothetical protein [Tessaracoccus bendigoensis]SHJ43584.1 hypothetical protein SAMN02745244_02506 [Tessaracoccus bendigoensis DSM 12906]
MSPRPNPRPRRPQVSPTELHRRWLQLVDVDGPFLSIPALRRVYPQGIATPDVALLAELKTAKQAFEQTWDAWSTGATTAESYRSARDEWVELVLRRTFGWGQHLTTADPHVTVSSPNQRVHTTSTGAFRRGETTHALTLVVDPVRSLRDLVDDGWAANHIDRMEALLRTSGVPVGVVTDGRWWALVSAQPGIAVASGVVDSQTWVEEPATRDALAALVSPIRLAGGRPEDQLPAMFADSVTAAEEITDALGRQVRRAVELLVQSFSETADEARRRGEPDPLPEDPADVYTAAVTVMMQVVFLLFAEERDLLPESALFNSAYGLTGQLDQLRQRERDESPEALDATSALWHRLLATARALHAGATFEDLRIPAYGGSLFDPDRFPFLTALTPRGTLALAVDDLVMMHVLDASRWPTCPARAAAPSRFATSTSSRSATSTRACSATTAAWPIRPSSGSSAGPGRSPRSPSQS